MEKKEITVRNEELLTQFANRRKESEKNQIMSELIANNDGLIRWFCNDMKSKKMLCTCFDYNDMYQTAVIGFMRAVRHYDSSKGALSTYAPYYMYAEVYNAHHSAVSVVHVPVNNKNAYCSISYDIDEVCYTEEGEETGLWETIPEDQPSTADVILHKELVESLYIALSTLTDRELKVLIKHFGLDGNERMTLRQIGSEYQCSEERVRQIIAKALRKLRHPSRSRQLQGYSNIFSNYGSLAWEGAASLSEYFIESDEENENEENVA